MKTTHRIALGLLGLVALCWPSAAAGQTVPFKVYITELWQLDAGVDPGVGQIGDYYAKVTINGVAQDNSGACDDGSLTGVLVPLQLFKYFVKESACGARTPWVFKRQLPPGQTVHIKIQLFDSDLLFDDEGDAKPGDGSAIELVVDPSSGQWSGDFAWPQACSRPHLEQGGNNVNVCWQAGFDSDDDGLLDVWERLGVDTDNDAVIDLDLAALGANPLRKDIFVELDHLELFSHKHLPNRTAIDRIVKSFANAPVTNADGTTGIQLHVDVGPSYPGVTIVPVASAGGAVGTYGDLGGGNPIPEAGNQIIDAFEVAKSSMTKFADLKAAHFNPLREPIFRYAIFGHQTNARKPVLDCTSGVASRTRRDFLVTLGGVDNKNKACHVEVGLFSVGSDEEQAGTFMHELGHTLGLRHGGDVDVNFKPNYLSVMNHVFQDCKLPTNGVELKDKCDYSRLISGNLLPPLDETSLDECVGIGLMGSKDWNNNGILEGVSQCGPIFANGRADVNIDGVCVNPGDNETLETAAVNDDIELRDVIYDGPDRVCDTKAKEGTDDEQATDVGHTPSQPNTLTSFDDWLHVAPSFIDYSGGSGTGNDTIDQETDSETRRNARRIMGDTLAPAITVDATGPGIGKPGDVLAYAVKVTNTGRGPAIAAVLRETNPDGNVRTSEIGTIIVGSEFLQTRDFTVPATACPGDLAGGAAAALSFTDFAGNPFTASDTVPLQILDVAAPQFGIILTSAGLWAPNHKFVVVNATLAITDNCDAAPAVTLVSIVSNEPESGLIGKGDAGPDIQGAEFGTDDRSFALRAQRDTGLGTTGRAYTVTYRVTDSSGNASTKSATVTVSTSNSGK